MDFSKMSKEELMTAMRDAADILPEKKDINISVYSCHPSQEYWDDGYNAYRLKAIPIVARLQAELSEAKEDFRVISKGNGVLLNKSCLLKEEIERLKNYKDMVTEMEAMNSDNERFIKLQKKNLELKADKIEWQLLFAGLEQVHKKLKAKNADLKAKLEQERYNSQMKIEELECSLNEQKKKPGFDYLPRHDGD